MKDTTRDVGKDGAQKVRRKPGRVPTSCAECRRMKLKCDKRVPCEKCVSRGCASICPDGSLVPGKGKRLILANTEQLHEEIGHLHGRIRDLESGLRELQASVSSEPHSLLKSGSFLTTPSDATPSTSAACLGVPRARSSTLASSKTASPVLTPLDPPLDSSSSGESSREETEKLDPLDHLGTLALGIQGGSSFFGRTARPEFFVRADTTQFPPRQRRGCEPPNFLGMEQQDHELRHQVLSLLPCSQVVQHLCKVYQELGRYMYSPLPKVEVDELLDLICRVRQYEPLPSDSVALLFAIFALAAHFDHCADAQKYYSLSRTALNLVHQATPRSLQASIHGTQFLCFSDLDCSQGEKNWRCTTQAVTYGLSGGLHLNSTHWNLPDMVVSSRRRQFWQLFHLDTWESFYFGRPPIISQKTMDHSLFNEVDRIDANDFHARRWKYAILLKSTVEFMSCTTPTSYADVLSFDNQIREFAVPPATPDDLNPSQPSSNHKNAFFMKSWIFLSEKEIALLNLHRPCLVRAVEESQSQGHLTQHRLFPSVVAAYRSARRIIEAIRVMWRKVPVIFSRIPLPWSNGLSAGIVMCLLVSRAPTFMLAQSALAELEALTKLFHSASEQCPSAAALLEPVESLYQRARVAANLIPTAPARHLSNSQLDRIAGKTCLMAEERASPDDASLQLNCDDGNVVTPRGASSESLPGVHTSLDEDVQSVRLLGKLADDDCQFPFDELSMKQEDDEPFQHTYFAQYTSYPPALTPGAILESRPQHTGLSYLAGGCGCSQTPVLQHSHQRFVHHYFHHSLSALPSFEPPPLDPVWQNFAEALGFCI